MRISDWSSDVCSSDLASGALLQTFSETVDGEYQGYKAKGGKFTREHFFGKYPQLGRLVETMSDEDIARLNRGGNDPHKIYAAYAAARKHQDSPTVILAKTFNEYCMGEVDDGQKITPQDKKMGERKQRKV